MRLCIPGAAAPRWHANLSSSGTAKRHNVLTYFVAEFVFFRVLLPSMPLQLRPHLPDVADVLVQNSKSSFVPHDYVALLGDSYAEGIGD